MNPNSEALVLVTVVDSIMLPTLIGGVPGALGAFADPHVVNGEQIMVPATTAAWLVGTGRALAASWRHDQARDAANPKEAGAENTSATDGRGIPEAAEAHGPDGHEDEEGTMTTRYKEFSATVTRSPGSGRERVRTFQITTQNPDREGDTINPDGWRLDNYRRNPVVLWSHRHADPSIGKALSVFRTAQGLGADVKFPGEHIYPFADTILGLIDFGALNATSVGFDPIKYVYNEQRRGYDFLEQELLEFSVVPVPANAEALQMAAKALGARFAPYRRWAGAGAPAGFRDAADFEQRTQPCGALGRPLDDEIVLDLDDLLDRKEPAMTRSRWNDFLNAAQDAHHARLQALTQTDAQRERLAASIAWNAATIAQRNAQMGVGTDATTGVTKGDMLQAMREVVSEIAGPIVARRLRQMAGRLL